MKKLFMLLAITGLLFTSCSKDDDNSDTNSVKFGSELVNTPYSFLIDYDGYYGIFITSVSDITKPVTGKPTAIQFLINFRDGVIKEGEYTYSDDMATDYDPEKHYFDAVFRFNGKNWTQGDMKNGKIKITKSGSDYIFEYSFTTDNKSVTGYYKGSVTNVYEDDLPK